MNHTNRSPTESFESRSNWARKERCILETQHQTHPPTHEAVAKFLRPVPKETLQKFQRRMRQSLAYWSESNAADFAVYFVREAERNNCVHYHFLIRTSESRPRIVLQRLVAKASDGHAVLQHCDAIDSVAAITRYVVKDMETVRTGERDVLLFKADVRLHLSGGWNGYFQKTKAELWAEWKWATYRSSAK